MGATIIVSGLLEGLQLVTSLSQALAAASTAVQTAQATGKPVDFAGILGSIGSHEANVLAAIAAAKAAGK